jgi:hypothetical protein
MMLDVEFRESFADAVIEPRKPSVADQFQRVLTLLKFEYDLDSDVLAEAELLLAKIEGEEIKRDGQWEA